MTSVEKFVAVAQRFSEWAEKEGKNENDLPLCLMHLSKLIAAALELPAGHAENGSPEYQTPAGQYDKIVKTFSNFPVHEYSCIVNASNIHESEIANGCVTDDIADIYNDIANGFYLYKNGYDIEDQLEPLSVER